MNMKSLLLGSAAALAAVSFAHAAEIVPSSGGGGCATHGIVAETRSLEIGIITSDPFELASNETGLISPDPIQLLAEYPDGDGIKAEGWGGVLDKQLVSNDRVGYAPLELAAFPQGGLIIEREGDGGTKTPIPPSGLSTQTRI
ncbi:MAG: hypothetical protein EON60_06095 [Alphaproteobacteria bacterium]|nr:MAG: hypothetical protein EON60_06095 [Alphaproteobacteria bacterium]